MLVTGLVHHIDDEAGTHAPRVTLPSPRIVTGFSGKEPGSAQAEEGVKKNKEERWRAAPQGEPCLRSGEQPAGICVAAGPEGIQHVASGKPQGGPKKREARPVLRRARASGNKDRHVGKWCAAGSAR
ncbi:hypothetical protein NDU88_006618 [Pleurodeles waltl]|uniref:Uncharacterized protein n=1 Tax=Pleurodeles waltl TaxID=8319 RepID=A0AAV7N2X6_PLEWA|nr:hypothetical protein NDU88_006618 [Pleurodeles waltl]